MPIDVMGYFPCMQHCCVETDGLSVRAATKCSTIVVNVSTEPAQRLCNIGAAPAQNTTALKC